MSIGSAAGYCTVHKMDKMFVGLDDSNTEPVCVKCKADSTPKLGRVQNVEDPGEDFFKTGKSDAKISIANQVPAKVAAASVETIESGLAKIVAVLNQMPMPKDMKTYKALLKIRQAVEKLSQEE